MPAYVIADVTVTDPREMEEYRKHVPGTLAACVRRSRALPSEPFALPR